MTHRNRAKSSSLFLVELILAILFFSIASAVCVQFFVKSHLLSRDARELNVAVTEVSNAAELINAADNTSSVLEMIQSEYPECNSKKPSRILVYFDQDFSGCGEKDAAYLLHIELSEEKSMLTGTLNMTRLKDDTSIYSLDILHHLQRRGGNGI